MKILFISHEASMTGAPIALVHIMDSIINYDKSIIIDLLLLKNGPLLSEFKRRCNSISVYKKYSSFVDRIVRRCFPKYDFNPYWKNIQKTKYDVIYANTVVSLDAAINIKQKYNIPIIAHIHESEYYTHRFGLTSEKMMKCDAFIAVSELSKDNLVNNYNIPSSKIQVQYPFSSIIEQIYGNQYPLKTNQSECKSDRSFVIGMSGSNNAWIKSFDIIPLLMKKIKSLHPDMDFQFVIVGNLDEDLIYKILFDLRKMKLDDCLVITGMVNNPVSYYSTFDLFLMMSREDSFPLVAEENAMLGKPIIAFSGATGVSEWIDNDSGFLIPYMDIDAVADTIYKLYSDRILLNRMGECAKNNISRIYREHSQMSVVLSVIEKFR